MVFVKWLMSEYKPEPVLTAREKGFIEFVKYGWIARSKEGELCWYAAEPQREWDEWVIGIDVDAFSFRNFANDYDHFGFITWEDEEPWSVEELRKLKVENED